MMPTEEDLYARERELSEQIARLSHYDRELRAIQERLDLLTAREQSGMPLSPSDNEVRDALLISLVIWAKSEQVSARSMSNWHEE